MFIKEKINFLNEIIVTNITFYTLCTIEFINIFIDEKSSIHLLLSFLCLTPIIICLVILFQQDLNRLK